MSLPHTTIAWYDANAEGYARTAYSNFDLDLIEAFTAQLPKGGKILDVGCGFGRDTAVMQDKGFQVTGLDLSEKLLNLARKASPRSAFVHASMTVIPLPDLAFDGLWGHASLLHLETDREVTTALLEFYRVLKDDGVLHVSVKARREDEPKTQLTDTRNNLSRLYRFFTESEVETVLTNGGFILLSLQSYIEADKWTDRRPKTKWIVALAKKK